MSKRNGVAAVVVLSLAALVGCQTVPIEDGRLPSVGQLSELTVGSSTRDDVVRLLGEPRGMGKTLHRPDAELRDILYYEYVLLKGDDLGLKLLLVYLKEDVYDGHLWFGASQFIERQI